MRKTKAAAAAAAAAAEKVEAPVLVVRKQVERRLHALLERDYTQPEGALPEAATKKRQPAPPSAPRERPGRPETASPRPRDCFASHRAKGADSLSRDCVASPAPRALTGAKAGAKRAAAARAREA